MNIRAQFESELQRRGIPFKVDAASNRYAVGTGDEPPLVSLDNLERDVARSADTGRISRFVDAIMASRARSLDVFSINGLYWNLEPADHKDPADFRARISEKVDRVLVHLSADRRLITWVTPGILATMGVSEQEAGSLAISNLGRALSEATFSSQDAGGIQLGMISTELPFKASLILAPNLREIIGGKLGWPLMAVVPDRDFLFLWDARHREFAGRVGSVVVREYLEAPYPISTEVFELDDEGARAVGAFPVGEQVGNREASVSAMKTITYRGGLVRFRIPVEWVEEYEEEGGGTFYQPGETTGTLRLSVMSMRAPKGSLVTMKSAEEFLVSTSSQMKCPVISLREGAAMVQYDTAGQETGQQLIIRTWQVAQAVPPEHVRLLLFTYTVLREQFEQREFEEELAMLEHEIRVCELAPGIGEVRPPAKKTERLG